MQTLPIRSRLLYLGTLFFLSCVHIAEAQIARPLSGVTDLSTFVAWLISLIVTILWPAVVVFWCFVGFKFVSAQGNEKVLEEARRALAGAVIGTAIVAGAQTLQYVIEGTISGL